MNIPGLRWWRKWGVVGLHNLPHNAPANSEVRPDQDVLLVPWVLHRCVECKRNLVPTNLAIDRWGSAYFDPDAIQQLGLVRQHLGMAGDLPRICVECVQLVEITFECAMCHDSRPLDDCVREFGDDPRSRLCRRCYESQPAAKWDAKVEELEEQHKYDFE